MKEESKMNVFGEGQHMISFSWTFIMNNMVKALRILKERHCLTLLIQHFPNFFDH